MELFLQIRADQLLVFIIRHSAFYRATLIPLVTYWRAKVASPAWKVDRGVQIQQRRFARVPNRSTYIFVILTK